MQNTQRGGRQLFLDCNKIVFGALNELLPVFPHISDIVDCLFIQYLFYISLFRTDSPEQSGSSSLLTGRSKVSRSREKASLISLVKYIKQRNNLDRRVPSLSTAGEEYCYNIVVIISPQVAHWFNIHRVKWSSTFAFPHF